jgi:branched-chain amino acid transport system permease protein
VSEVVTSPADRSGDDDAGDDGAHVSGGADARVAEGPTTDAGLSGRRDAGSPERRRLRRRWLRLSSVIVVAGLAALLVAPLFVSEFWLRTGFAVFGAIVGAIGLNILLGTTGQLSLAHAFFLAVGAVSYCYLAGKPGGVATPVGGLELPPPLALILAVGLSGLAGLLFSPIAARLRGIYLGIASLGLVFIGQHVLNTATSVTGGFNGRTTPVFSLFGFSFANGNPDLFVLDVPFGQPERLWYLGLALAVAAYLFSRNVLRGRPGRAMQALRDSEVAAAVMGVNVQRYKAMAFMVSSMYAGLSGVLYALSIGSVAPESFTLDVSVQYLAMVVIGGLGSVGGAVLGALFVSALPLVLSQYSDSLPFVAETGQPGISAGEGARYLYGAVIIIVVLFEPAGLVGFGRRFRRRAPASRQAAPSRSEPSAEETT